MSNDINAAEVTKSLSAQVGAPKKDWKSAMIRKKVPSTPVEEPAKDVPVQTEVLDEKNLQEEDRDRTEAPAEEVKAEKPAKEKKVKEPKTEKAPREKVDATKIEGFGYGLITRIRNAFSAEVQNKIEANAETVEMTTGRGQVVKICAKVWVKVAKDHGFTPEWVSSVRTSHVKAELKKKGVDIGKKSAKEEAADAAE